jgi:hypothetical protein
MNPPYGRAIGDWMKKAYEPSRTTAEIVVCLVPARTDTRWWHDYAERGKHRPLKGRVRFGDAKNSAPFPSMLVWFRRPASDSGPVDGLAEQVDLTDYCPSCGGLMADVAGRLHCYSCGGDGGVSETRTVAEDRTAAMERLRSKLDGGSAS